MRLVFLCLNRAAERWQDARLWQIGVAGFLLGMPLLGAFFASFKSKTTDNVCHVGLHAVSQRLLICACRTDASASDTSGALQD